MQINELYEKIKQTSLQQHPEIPFKKTIINISKTAIISILTITAAVSLCACSNVNKQENTIGINNYSTIAVMNAEDLLKQNNIQYYDKETGTKVSHTIEEYKQIKDLSEDDLLGLYKLLGKEESEKVVQALGYNDWNDYLIKNNYVNSKGEPNMKEWIENTQRENYYGGKK